MNAPVLLIPGEVHVWCVALDGPSEGFYASLGPDERERSARFRFERDRRRFVVAHGVLRDLLGRYLGTEPGEVRFAYSAFGKPALSPEFGSRFKFNLSHSAGCALIAVAAGAEIGVDVERVRSLPDQVEIARRFFSAAEVDQLRRLPSDRRTEAFFGCWTKKEAYGKARGEGLESARGEPKRGWSLYTLRPEPGYVGALVVEGSGWRLLSRRHEGPVTAHRDLQVSFFARS